ncbi:MAG TPA: hypothetical protein VKW08_01630 [Xanthobacteraceae bacterium]|nr:hypothetical protein [Xanthobacteraceae bacterium]
MMLTIWFLIGAVMGLRFRVLVLVPAMGIALPLTVAAAIIQGYSLGQTLVTAAVGIVGLQVGYLAGVGVRHLLVVARASRIRARSAADSAREIAQ